MEKTEQKSFTDFQVMRETIESLAVAFILALMFKAFIAEAFVIPTGSMAPTLMGAHKDIKCEECGFQFQCGASSEFTDVGGKTSRYVVGGVCPLCRKPQVFNPFRDSNHKTNSGDRILVSKLAYIFAEPKRWDVIVFKFIGSARMNYIKRCIGLPNETVRIRYGDIYTQNNDPKSGAAKSSSFEIARKPPHVVNATLQPIADTYYRAKSLFKAGLPSSWQPHPLQESSWKVNETETNWSATISNAPAGAMHWIRFRHRVVDPLSWKSVSETGLLPASIPPTSSRLITDFAAYNSAFDYIDDADFSNPGQRAGRAKSSLPQLTETEFEQVAKAAINRGQSSLIENDGNHWVGDLATEIEIKLEPSSKSLSLMIVECGVEHVCQFDLASGTATAKVLVNEQAATAFEGENGLVAEAKANTSVRAGGTYRIRFANVDDTLTLWVNGRHVPLGPSGKLQTANYLGIDQRKPHSTPSNPLDAAPIAVGLEGGGAEILRARVFRDIYYLAAGPSDDINDYEGLFATILKSSPNENNDRYSKETHGVSYAKLKESVSDIAIHRNAALSNANQWAVSPLFSTRRTVDFRLQPEQFFPMGDNSGASSDARSWRIEQTGQSRHFIPKRLMIGRAVLIFWPHYWNAPIKFLPNVQRMGLIR